MPEDNQAYPLGHKDSAGGEAPEDPEAAAALALALGVAADAAASFSS